MGELLVFWLCILTHHNERWGLGDAGPDVTCSICHGNVLWKILKQTSKSFFCIKAKEGRSGGWPGNQWRRGWERRMNVKKMCDTDFWNVGCLYSTNVVTSCFVIKLSYRLLVRECICWWPFTTINFTPTKILKSMQPSAPSVCISRV